MALTIMAAKGDMQDAPETRFEPSAPGSEAQNRFVAENMRRVFLQIYRLVGNVADAQDLTDRRAHV